MLLFTRVNVYLPEKGIRWYTDCVCVADMVYKGAFRMLEIEVDRFADGFAGWFDGITRFLKN